MGEISDMKRVLLLLLLLLFVMPVSQGTEPAVKLDSLLLQKAGKITRKSFPDADSVLLRENEHYTYEKSGIYKVSDEIYIKILTEKGRQELRNLKFYFNTHYNRVKVHKLTVIKPDGSRVEVDIAGNSRNVIDSSQMASNIYDPASRNLVVSVPRLEIGDLLYLKSSDEHFKPRIPGFWSNYSLLQSNSPILENNIEVNGPEELPLRSIAIKDEVKGTVAFSRKKIGGRIIYKWSARNVPQVIPEPGMPELHTCVQRLLVSTAGSWEEVSRWYWKLCRPRLDAVTPAMKKHVETLVRGKKSEMEKVKALFQFVSQNVRYMGITPEKEAPGYEPHDVKLTFEQRYGVCRDKAALLVSMLELAGFKAYPVLFMAGDPKDDEIPNGYFNHAVTAVELGKGNYVLMDPTYESTTELFPAFQADMSYLVAHPRGEKLRRSPVVPARENCVRIRTKAQVGSDLKLRGESSVRLLGVNDLYYRGALSRWTAEEKKRFFTGRLQKILPGAVLEDLKVIPENIRDMSRNIEFRFRFSAPAGKGKELQLLPLPEFASIFGIGEAVFQGTSLLSRKYPLKLASTCSTDEEYTVALPRTFRMRALPQPERFNIGKKITFGRSMFLSGGVLKGRRVMDVNTLELTAGEYPELKRLLGKIRNSAKVIPVAHRDFKLNSVAEALEAFPDANSVIEEMELFVNIKDPANWSVRNRSRRKILNYAGVKEHSEVKVHFLPGWTELGKVDVAVVAPDGKVRKVMPSEINVMDSPRNGSAPRYPAEKVMVISLPGVVPGSSLVLDITRNYVKRPFFSGQFCFVSRSAPVIRGALTVTAPENMYLKSSISGDAVPRFEERREEGKQIRVWQFSNLPRVQNEAGQPLWQLFLPGVLLSSEDNKSYALMLNKLLAEKVERSLPAAEKVIKEQKWHKSGRKESLIIAVRDYVDKFIRKSHVSLKDIPLSALSEAAETLKTGYGHSADRAILLGALLKALNIEYRFVGVSLTGGTQQTARLFNHNPDPESMTEEILLYVPDLQWYLNDTGRYAFPGSVNSENKLGLELNTGRLVTIQTSSLLGSCRSLKFHIECKADDSALIRVTESLYGKYYEQVKEFLENATPERRRRFFEERASAVSHTGKLTGVTEYRFNAFPGVLTYTVKADEFLSRAGEFRIMPLPRYDLLQIVGALPVSGGRTTPYWRNSASRLILRYSIVPPPGFTVVPGRKEKIQEGKYGSAQFTEDYSAVSGQITIYSRLFLPVELVTPLDFCELENRKLRVSQPEADRILFKKINLRKKHDR